MQEPARLLLTQKQVTSEKRTNLFREVPTSVFLWDRINESADCTTKCSSALQKNEAARSDFRMFREILEIGVKLF
jgi:hypothetical protein